MIILGIDPGFICTGFSVMKTENSSVFLYDCGALQMGTRPAGGLPSSSKSLVERVGVFYEFFEKKIIEYKIERIALETPFLGKNAQNFLKLGYLRGILYLLASKYDLSVLEFTPREIKYAITGFGGAEKEQIARVMVQLFPGLQMPRKFDITDALAVAFCGLLKSNLS